MATKVSIPGVQVKRATITIVGDTPLLSHHFSEKSIQDMRDKQQKLPRGALPPKDPEAEYKSAIYYTEDDKPGFPASGVKKACVSACRFIDDMAMTQARGAFQVMGDILPLEGNPEMREDVVRLPHNTTDLRYRALYREWSITFTVVYDPRVISLESIVNLVETAGFHVGLGDWRPEKNGTFGMFHVQRD